MLAKCVSGVKHQRHVIVAIAVVHNGLAISLDNGAAQTPTDRHRDREKDRERQKQRKTRPAGQLSRHEGHAARAVNINKRRLSPSQHAATAVPTDTHTHADSVHVFLIFSFRLGVASVFT